MAFRRGQAKPRDAARLDEVGPSGVPPAVANAVLAATRERLRSFPPTPTGRSGASEAEAGFRPGRAPPAVALRSVDVLQPG
jgi:hypothetical protein